MKRFNLFIIIAIIFAMVFTMACSKKVDDPATGKRPVTDEKADTSEETTTNEGADASEETDASEEASAGNKAVTSRDPFKSLDQALVDGAFMGSRSDHVKDREFWKDLTDPKLMELAKNPVDGLHMPEILLTSNDAMKVNDELINLSQEFLKIIEESKDDYAGTDLPVDASFSAFDDGEIISVHLKYLNLNEGYFIKHKVYNFLIPDRIYPSTGKLISDAELLEHFGIGKDEIMGRLEATIQGEYNRMANLYDSQMDDTYFLWGTKYFEGKALEELWESYNPQKSRIFIDQNGQANFIYKQYTDGGSGESIATAPIAGMNINDSEISPAFIQTAKALGLNPEDKNIEAFILFVGGAYDEETTKSLVESLYPWQAVFNNYADPVFLPMITTDPETFDISLMGQEFYLVIPKYKATSIALRQLDLTEQGKLSQVENLPVENMSVTGPALLAVNISDIYSNAKIILKHRDQVSEFTPFISLKDGSLIIDQASVDGEGIVDATGLFENLPAREDFYSYLLYTKILSLIK